MKKLLKIVAVLIIILIVALLGLQIFLNHGLNPVVQKALPQISKKTGMDIGIGNVAINLFGGSLRAENLRIANPTGFKEPNLFSIDNLNLDVGLKALLNKTIRVSDANVKNAKFTLVRNAEGAVNLQKLQEKLPKNAATNPPPAAVTPTTETATRTDEKSEEPIEIPKVQIDQLAFTTLFEFVDFKTTNAQPNRLGLDLNLDASDIVTFGEKTESEWGNLHITGGLHQNPEAFKIDIKAKVAPITSTSPLSFTANGKMADLDLEKLGDIKKEIGITSSAIDLQINLAVNQGQFKKGSQLVATLHNAKLTGKLKRKYKHVKLMPKLSITIPIKGSLAKPEIHITQAITASILRNIKENPDYLLDNISVDGKSLRHRLNKGLNKIHDK